MRVILKEREYEYESDFPNDWKESSGDFFKFPVVIGKYETFIKRFERKRPEDISGWNLLVNLKGRFVQNLPRVFDIESNEENNHEVFYLFQEYLQGETLEKVIAGNTEIDLQRLTNDLFTALKTLHENDFWFADFCAKNIFYDDERRRFLLIDLDSAQQISRGPQQDMWGDREYWALVFNFYKEVLGNKEFKAADLPGIVLNYLQVVFLVLRIKILTNSNDQLSAGELFAILPAILDKTDPAFRKCFSKGLQDETKIHFTEWTEEVKSLIFSSIIDSDIDVDFDELIQNTKPIIESFTSDKHMVEGGAHFLLKWKVANATTLELHKNGVLSKKINVESDSLNVSEFFDGKPRKLHYTLVATNNSGVAKSEPVTVMVTDELEAISEIHHEDEIHFNEDKGSVNLDDKIVDHDLLKEHQLKDDSTNKYDSLLNNNNQLASDVINEDADTNSITNNTDNPANNTSDNTANNTANNPINNGGNGEEIYKNEATDRKAYLRKIKLAVMGLVLAIIVTASVIFYTSQHPGKLKFSILRYNLTEGNSLVIFSNNFPKDSSNVQVLFNKVKANIIEYSKTSIQVIVPELGSNLGDGNVKVALVVKGDTTYADHELVVKENTKPETDKKPEITTIVPTTKDTALKFKPVKIVLKNNLNKKQMKVDTSNKNVTIVQQPVVVKEKKRSFNIYDFVKVNSGDIKKKIFGGMKNVKVIVENNSPYDVDSVSVQVSYLKDNEEVVRNEIKTFTKISSHNSSTIELPGAGKAKKVDLKILSISSRQMDNDLQ